MDKFIATEYDPDMQPCNCIGPQDGERLCPCLLRKMAITPARGLPMPRTVEYYQANAIRDQELILSQRDQLERADLTINQLRQNIAQLKEQM